MKMLSLRASLLPFSLLLGLTLLSSGCSWMRGKTGYEQSPESRPLEVPPDLDTPRTDPTMQIPAPSAAAPRSAAAAPAPSAAFVIDDTADSAWRRLGLALERIDGVAVTQKAQALSAYNVTYRGSEFLVRVVASGQQSRIEAVTADGSVVSSGPAADLLGLLRARLG